MSVVISDQRLQSPLTLHALNQDIQQEILSFCSSADPFLYARVNRAAAVFSKQTAVSSLYFSLKTTNYLDWEKIEKDTAVLAHITDQQVQNLNAEQTQDFIHFLQQLREIVGLEEGDEKKVRLFKLFLSFCPAVIKLDLTTRREGEVFGNKDEYPSLYVISSILDTRDIHSRIKVLRLNGFDKHWNLISVFSSHVIHFDSLESLECHLSTEDLDLLTSTSSFQKHLKSLAIARSRLLSLAPLEKLTNLQELDLRGTIIEDLGYENLVPLMPKLRLLELGTASHFTDPTIQAICKAAPRLEELKIENATYITNLAILSISKLRFLRKLHLAGCSENTNKLFEYLTESPYLRKSLQSLKISYSKDVRDDGIVHIGSLENLTEIDLSGITVTEDDFASFVSLKQLQKLNCAFINPTERTLAHIGEIRSLRHLDGVRFLQLDGIKSKAITDSGIQPLQNLKNLRFLHLQTSDQFSDEGFKCLSNLARLEYLRIHSRCPISTTTLQNLGNLRRLKKLFLYGGSLEAPREAVLTFIKSHPELDPTRVGLGNKNPEEIQRILQEQ